MISSLHERMLAVQGKMLANSEQPMAEMKVDLEERKVERKVCTEKRREPATRK
jgi:hypothetical protein